MAKRRRGGARRAISRARGGFQPRLEKAVRGLGYATLAGAATMLFAPQFTPVARLGAAVYGGGVEGAVGELLVSQGPNLMNMVGGLFGGQQAAGGNGQAI